MRQAHSPNILICESRGLRDTVAMMTVQQNIERLRQFYLVPYGDEDGSRTIFGPQHCSEHLPMSSIQRSMGPSGWWWLLITTGETR